MKKRTIIVPLVFVLVCGTGAGAWYYYNHVQNGASDEEEVFVDKVGDILGIVSLGGSNNRFAGVVEAQGTEKVEPAGNLKVKTTFVSVGDEVKVGDKLFEYDTDDAQDNITQLEIDIENEDISIETATNQVAELKKLLDKASDSEKLSLTNQIMTTENSIKRYEYEKKSKVAEMESLKKQIANSVVYSEFQGIVKSINKSMMNSDDTSAGLSSDEDSNAFITIMSTGAYRIKGTVNEQNMSQIQVGTDVLVYSRVDESVYWKGTVSTIDKEHTTNSSSSMYGYSDDSMSSSSSYPFYVELENSDDLMLGQHVYVVQNVGQEDQEGLWLEDYYFIADEEGNPTNKLWIADENDRLAIREVTLGEYDEDRFAYEILDGLSVDDYLAFPTEDLTEGMKVSCNSDISYESSDDAAYYYGDLYNDEEDSSLDDGEIDWDDEEIDWDDADMVWEDADEDIVWDEADDATSDGDMLEWDAEGNEVITTDEGTLFLDEE